MNIVTIAEAKNKIGEILPCVKGKLVELWEYKAGKKPGAKVGYSFQNGVLLDHGERIKVTFAFRHEVPADMKGKDFILTSKMMGKGGLSGLKVEEKEWNGKKELILTVDRHAVVEEDSGDDIQYDPPPELPVRTQDAPKANVETTEGIPAVRRRLAQMGYLYRLCFVETFFAFQGREVSEETQRAAASCLFIQGIKEQLDHKLSPDLDGYGKRPTIQGENPAEDLEQGEIPF